MEPTRKSEAMEWAILRIFGCDRRTAIRNGVCVTPVCANPLRDFPDEKYEREARISGLCVECQDRVFNAPDEDEYEDEPFGSDTGIDREKE